MASSLIKSERGYDKKIEQIDTIIRLIGENSVIGLTSLSGISSKALQGIRSSMRSGEVEATIKVAKNTLKAIALEKILRKSDRKDLKKIIPHINGSCAMIFTNTNPFRLQKFLNQNQVPAPAKTGQISTVDVFVPEGVTNLDPGPIISELGSIGLQTRIEKGKIRITKTARVLSKGEVVTESHAAVLTRLGIQPFKVGLKLNTVLEGGELIDGSVLDVDEDEIIADLQKAHLNALSLALNPKLTYYTPLTLPIFLKIAISQAMKLSFESNFITDKTVSPLLLKASNKAEILKERVLSRDTGIQF